ncbi:MAG: nitrous oxide reductase accessory protein NosL [Anaerolineales bacterium]|nr:nitrous oxide reductase accessory protein NosL [Anaerolineales bacterium]
MKIRQGLSGRFEIFLLFSLFILACLAGCRQAVDLQAPPEIIIGQDVCDQCGMLIGEAKYAAAYWTVDGQPRRFDDIGGMMAYYHTNNEEVASFWVHDFVSEAWLPANEATFLSDAGLQTPMGYGIIAFATAEQARAHRTADAAVLLSFDELLKQTASGTLETPGQHTQAADQ